LKFPSILKKVLLCCAAPVLVAVVVYIRYGGTGRPFPALFTQPILPASLVEVVAVLDQPPGNLAVSKEGRVFFTYHAESRPDIKVLELVKGNPVPYPNLEFQNKRHDGKSWFDQVFSLRIDRQNRLWTLDHGFHGIRQPRLLAFDLASGKLVHEFNFPSGIAGIGSYIQDMQIDASGVKIYIAYLGVLSKKPAIIIYDTITKTARRILECHPTVMEQDYEINSKGRRMYLLFGLYWMHPAIDPIALDKNDEWLYFGPMSGDTLYRARVADLNDTSLTDKDLGRRIESFSKKSQCDGLTMDTEGNIYVTSMEDGAINIIGQDRVQKTLITHPLFRWPDGLSFGPDGYVYIADSDIPDIMLKSKSHIKANGPYYIFRFQSGKKGIPGQ
jgi:sugar lactone lactonase YvrE